jgi:hypothetical protein
MGVRHGGERVPWPARPPHQRRSRRTQQRSRGCPAPGRRVGCRGRDTELAGSHQPAGGHTRRAPVSVRRPRCRGAPRRGRPWGRGAAHGRREPGEAAALHRRRRLDGSAILGAGSVHSPAVPPVTRTVPRRSNRRACDHHVCHRPRGRASCRSGRDSLLRARSVSSSFGTGVNLDLCHTPLPAASC